MELKQGQAYIKMYEDSACTKEFKVAPNGDYVLNIKVPTGNSSFNYTKNLYIRNIGSHTAYNITATKISDSSNKATLTLEKTTLISRYRQTLKVTVPYNKEEVSNYTVAIKLDYDNIP